MKKSHHTIIFLITILLNMLSVKAGAVQASPQIRIAEGKQSAPIDIVRVRPTKSDERRTSNIRNRLEKKGHYGNDEGYIYAVKLYIEMPLHGAESPEIFIGESSIGEYGSWDGGVFFKLYHQADLYALFDQSITIFFQGERFDPSVKFPSHQEVNMEEINRNAMDLSEILND